MSKIALSATLTAAEGKGDDLEAALHTLVAAADEEPGLEIYTVARSQDDPNIFIFYELYTDADALAAHGKGDKMKAAMGSMGGLLAGRPETSLLDPVAGKGVDL